MVCGGGRKWFRFGRLGRNGRQGRYFHDEVFDRVACGGAGFGQQTGLMQSQASSPGRTRCNEYEPSVAQIRESTFAGQCFGQMMAELSIKQVQCTRSRSERVEGYAFGNWHQRAVRMSARRRVSLHGSPLWANMNEHNLSRKIPFNSALH